ncbi:DUF7576 family protein [Natrinema salifodinae]|uniref:TRASH domain-containing protein n=1 Tax=Natrinema salifodinae TaxID=1202768 RepID=A0A1I0NN98_9EURY|nr:hypothetical protein [Natrinema salifodinae]SEW02885.1 hypothetical protein SAMN05216285_1931 [Natrinema salifodinae]
MTDSTAEDAPECRQCGSSVGSTADRRVVPTVEDGEAVYRHFCSDDCLEIWEAAN